MTPAKYLQLEKFHREIIEASELEIGKARKLAEKCKFPKKSVRPAVASDIVEGAVIWHKNGDDGPFWNIVSEPLHYGDPFKAYEADDGCRYGLDGAYVERGSK